MRKPRLIYYNDGRHYHLYRHDPPMSLHRLQEPVDDILGTAVDTLSYGLATGLTFLHDTKVGIKFGENVTEHNSGLVWWRAATNLVEALEAGYDPLKVAVDRAHEKGIQIICSMRMNGGNTATHFRGSYTAGKLQRYNPEALLGEEDPESPSVAGAYDYARPEVREERLAVIEEVCDRYGADGFEFDDSMRVFFKASQIRENTPILTQFMRDVRALLDRIGGKRGEELMLAARVHPVEEANLSVGMDVRTWISEKLVNVIIPLDGSLDGWFLLDQHPSIEWLTDVAKQAGAWVYGQVSRTLYDDRYHTPTVEMYRAAASNLRAAGADGLYMSDLPWPHTEREYQVLREMGDPDIHARKSKHYFLGQKYVKPGPFPPERHIPVTLEEGVTARMPIRVGDGLDSARADNELEKVRLGVRVVQTCPKDRLSFRLNGAGLPLDTAKISTYYGGLVAYGAHRTGLPQRILTHYWYHFDLPLELAREGENEVEVTMDFEFKPFVNNRVVQNVELLIDYKEPPVPVQGQM